MRRIAAKKRKAVLGAPDGRITPRAGLQLVKKLDELLGIATTIDAAGTSFKSRRRGLGLGALVLSVAETMLAGGDFLCDLDTQRKDRTGARLRTVEAIPASTTVIGLGKRFDATMRRGVERANAELVGDAFARLGETRRAELCATRPTIDLDPTDVEVYGRKKRGAGPHRIGFVGAGTVAPRYNYRGKTNCRCHGDPPQPHGPYLHWTAKVDGKTDNRRLSPKEAELYREWIANDRRLRAMIDELRAVPAQATDLIIEDARRTEAEVKCKLKVPPVTTPWLVEVEGSLA